YIGRHVSVALRQTPEGFNHRLGFNAFAFRVIFQALTGAPALYYPFDKPRRWINSGGLGTMGFGLPAALGVKMALPKE
ncbi:thiamine pyrophosphate-dependent enzyme, partial [Salmonella enterica subsp. enterica serovar Infantis]